ncbi:hypothetical protein ASPWEDRAFT_690766 [Aspergillus wentii DTO 134E9]|uniref:Uncharacterized protein n=1 Tax=Aspergillus wentii DTO 134E9 TaxID=1073089 RepID=A0A1L9R933_ASPWE|nr:uncharacterized protein ASPWEDRAFT_690766 [Aspergillus wentii DTO 134E9]OJJ31367.1 hypothetical protein ASPWEDRAFT_690766 [Aspergillus wentii DTO 134E9]
MAFTESEFFSHLPGDTPSRAAIRPHAISNSLEKNFHPNGDPKSAYVIFTSVPPETIQRLIHYPHQYIILSKRLFYNEDLRTLIVKMPWRAHITAIEEFKSLIHRNLFHNPARHGLSMLGHTTYEIPPFAKEADDSYAPRRVLEEWPTMVIEVGRSDCLDRLRFEANWWLVRSDGVVRIAIIIVVNHDHPEIVFEMWQRPASQPEHSHALRSLTPQVTKTQEVRISRCGNDTVTVGAPLTIRLEDVLLRAPPGDERGFVFTAEKLEYVAHFVWETQGFIPLSDINLQGE